VKDGEAGCGTMYLIAPSKRITEKAEEAIGYTGMAAEPVPNICLPSLVLK